MSFLSVISCARFLRYFSVISLLFYCSLSFSQTPQPRYPIGGDRVSPNPKFTAIPASLVSSGVTYNVVVSEQPRGGGAGVDQYIDFWVKEGLSASSLLESNLYRVGWDSSWVRKTRNGAYTGTPTILPNATPASLVAGKTYYWHVVGTNGTKSVENTFVIVDPARISPTHLAPSDGAIVSASAQNPCFSWSLPNVAAFSNYTITVSTTPDFPSTRWHYQINSISTTSVCWNNGSGWASKGTTPPAAPGPLQNGVTYYWRVLATYTDSTAGRDFVGRSFVYRASSSSSSLVSSSKSSSSSSRSSTTTSRSSSSSSALALFDFATQAPSAFNYPLTNSGVPTLGASQLVATTQGNLNVSNGAANYSIPIELPPAVRDLKPNLSLSYNSRAGNGLMGVGWNLGGLSAITRCRTNFATEGANAQDSNPRYTVSDRLCLDGQKLVVASIATPANDSVYWALGTEYKTEVDNFAKVVAYGSSANGGHGYFKVWTKDGRVLTYGEQAVSQNSKIYATNQYGGVVSAWALDRVEDAYNNNYSIIYEQNNVNGQYYPSQIQLGSLGLVVFTYQSRVGQTPWGYDVGNKYQLTQVLDKVTTYVGTTTATPIKQYDINYKTSATTNRELVDKIYECGYESSSWKCAKPVTFDWQAGELGFESTPQSLAFTGLMYEDFNGDGYVDVIGDKSLLAWGNANGSFTASGYSEAQFVQLIQTRLGKAVIRGVRRTQGSIKYLDVYLSRLAPSTAMTSELITSVEYNSDHPVVKVVDLNNDGMTDLTVNSRFWIQQNNASFIVSSISTGSDYIHAGAELSYVDANSDGLLDQTIVAFHGLVGRMLFHGVMRDVHNNPLYVHLNAGNGFGGVSDSFGRVGSASPTIKIPGVSAAAPLFQAYKSNIGFWKSWIDINGDGNSDVLYDDFHTADLNIAKRWAIRLSTGDSQPSTQRPTIPTGISVMPMDNNSVGQYSFVMDYNKDGLDDFIVFTGDPLGVRNLRVFYGSYINGTLSFANGGVDPFMGKLDYLKELVVVPAEETINPFRGDTNNDGVPDLVINNQVYLGKQQQPDLINKITDDFGVATELSYSPLMNDVNNGSPLYTPDSVAPVFPLLPVNRAMQVVKKISTSNGQGGSNHTYFNYTAGVQDAFRGFGGFKTISITNIATKMHSTTEYRQDWPYSGRIKKQILKDTAGKLISITDNNYALHPQNARFPYLQYSLQKSYELSTTNESSPLSVSKSVNTFDTCGNVTEQNTKVGNGFSGVDVTGELSNQRTVNAYEYYGTPACNDDFLTSTTQEMAKAGNTDLKTLLSFIASNCHDQWINGRRVRLYLR